MQDVDFNEINYEQILQNVLLSDTIKRLEFTIGKIKQYLEVLKPLAVK